MRHGSSYAAAIQMTFSSPCAVRGFFYARMSCETR